jgi:hypothetical protein
MISQRFKGTDPILVAEFQNILPGRCFELYSIVNKYHGTLGTCYSTEETIRASGMSFRELEFVFRSKPFNVVRVKENNMSVTSLNGRTRETSAYLNRVYVVSSLTTQVSVPETNGSQASSQSNTTISSISLANTIIATISQSNLGAINLVDDDQDEDLVLNRQLPGITLFDYCCVCSSADYMSFHATIECVLIVCFIWWS